MNINIYEDLILNGPFGFAYHKVVLDDEKNVIDYIFLDMNEKFESMTGFNREEILNKRVSEVLPGIREERFDWISFYGKVAMNGETHDFTEYSEELGKWYKVTTSSNKIGYFSTFTEDVTEEMSKIQELEDEKNRFENLSNDLDIVFNSTQDSMVLIKVDGDKFTLIRNNTAHQIASGISLEEFKGKSLVEILGEEKGIIFENNYKLCSENNKKVSFEVSLNYPIGIRTWNINLNPVVEKGKVSYIVSAGKDITVQKKIEKEKERLIESTNAMFMEHSAVKLIMDPKSGKIIDANPSALTFYGYSKEEILALNINDINAFSDKGVSKYQREASHKQGSYFLSPHRLKSGEIRYVDVYSSPIDINGDKYLYSIIFDVSDREEFRVELFQEKELLRTTLLSIGDGVVTTDKNGIITSMNIVAEEITAWEEKEAIGKPFSCVFKLISEATLKRVENPIKKVLDTGKIIGLANHTALINKNGKIIPVADSAAPIKDNEGNIFGVVMVIRDVTKEKEQMDKILYLSYYDTLTGLYNRGFMEEELKRLETLKNTSITVILGDLNGLKLVNDIFGHTQGDKLLKNAANIITKCCRQGDIIARWGGDEFLILLPNTDSEAAEKVIKRIMEKSSYLNDDVSKVSIALGYAVKKNDTDSLIDTIKDAEEQMYRRKLLEGRSFRHSIMDTMISTLYSKSMETQAHTARLQDQCVDVGNRLHLASKDLDELLLLALLHDIGKIAINENILMKPSALNEEEWKEMKRHPEIGYRIARNIPELSSVADYILHHHERWDGKGYPEGLSKEKIPIHCRILAVVDAYDAMTNDRCYRKAMTEEEALQEIRLNRNKQFDGEVVDVFIKYKELGE